MITLNIDKGLVRLESWDDVLSRPGFKTDIDPKTTKLDRIIGNYNLSTYQLCGLSVCRTLHGKGYLVATRDGHETNIGKDCGKKYFDVAFTSMEKVFNKDLRNKERREALSAFQNRIPSIEAQIQVLLEGTIGAKWINKQVRFLVDPLKGLPSPVTAVVNGLVRRRAGTLTRSRVTTQEERDRLRAQGAATKRDQQYVDEVVGQLEGISALYPENNLRELLVTGMDMLAVIKVADVDSLKDKALRDLAKWIISVDPTMARAEETIEAGRRLLTKNNLQQLLVFIDTKAERRTFNTFLVDLPEVYEALPIAA